MKRMMLLFAAANSLLVVGCASTPRNGAQATKQVNAPPPGCTELGEVRGTDSHYGDPGPSAAVATKDAIARAESLGATHVQVVRVSPSENWELSCWAIAYRCPAAPQ